jgi:hypothetical protein
MKKPPKTKNLKRNDRLVDAVVVGALEALELIARVDGQVVNGLVSRINAKGVVPSVNGPDGRFQRGFVDFVK